jgi:hypothetical protein
MYLRRDSAAGVRFLAAVKEGRGLKPSARAAGIGKQTGYRWLRESFVMLREKGLSVEAAQSELGFVSPLMLEWDKQHGDGRAGRHHLRVGEDVEDAFWRCFLAGDSLDAARRLPVVAGPVLGAARAGSVRPCRWPAAESAVGAGAGVGGRAPPGPRTRTPCA